MGGFIKIIGYKASVGRKPPLQGTPLQGTLINNQDSKPQTQTPNPKTLIASSRELPLLTNQNRFAGTLCQGEFSGQLLRWLIG